MKVDELKKREKALREREKSIATRVDDKRKAVFERFPLLFTLLGSFGLVMTYYGFERLIDQVQYFQEHPTALFISGLLILFVTGSIYKKLS